MVTPAQMPKKVNPIRTQILGSLIEGVHTTRTQKILVRRAEDGKLDVVEQPGKPAGFALRWPLAQNVSEANVEALAKRWL
jgi:hypothetical protein